MEDRRHLPNLEAELRSWVPPTALTHCFERRLEFSEREM